MEKITEFKHKCIIIRIRPDSIGKSQPPFLTDCKGKTPSPEEALYEAVRRCWRISLDRAQKADYVLILISNKKDRLEVKHVFKPVRWYYLDDKFCKEKEKECKKEFRANTDLCKIRNRIAFEGKKIPDDKDYLNKLIPEKFLPAQNPVRFTYE